MGLDYIRSATGKPWKKRWAAGLDKLKGASLLDLKIAEGTRTVTAVLCGGASVSPGDTFVVEKTQSGLLLCDGLKTIGTIPDPTYEMESALANSAGVAEATISRVGLFGDTVELELK